MSIIQIPNPGDPESVRNHHLVRGAEEMLKQAIAIASLEAKVEQVDHKADQAMDIANVALKASKRSDAFIPLMPILRDLGVKIPKGLEGAIGAECKAIAISLGDNPEARGKEQIGQFPTWTYPRDLAYPIARRWILQNQNRIDRAHMFPKIWTMQVRKST